MPNLVPGFRWAPVAVGNRAKRQKGRGLIGHVAVSSSKHLGPGSLTSRGSDWHFYLPKVGPGIQQIDLDVQSWSSGDANDDTVSFESEGGLGDSRAVNREPWTADQIESAAQILAHMHRTEGVPLQVMPDSRPSSRGFGFHRLGIDPWRVSGGQVWSTSRGKLCPGDAKVAQAPLIVARAKEIVSGNAQGDDMANVPQDQWDTIYKFITEQERTKQGWSFAAQAAGDARDVLDIVEDIREQLQVPGAVYAWLPALNNKLDALQVQIGAIEAIRGDGGIDVEALAAKLGDILGAEVADELADRLASKG